MYMHGLSVRNDASTSSTVSQQASGVPYDTFLGLVWTGACLSSVFLVLRLVSRLQTGTRRLFWDDGLAFFAWLLVLVTAALWQWSAREMYYILDVSAGLATPDADFVVRVIRFARIQFVVELFFYTTLFAVKLSFLLFFRRLGHRVNGQQYIWWPVFIFAWISYAVSVGDIQYVCELGPIETLETYCFSASATRFTVATLKANCALDVFSDFLIVLIPISILWNVRISFKKKVAFIGIFSLTIITMIIAIVRAVSISSARQGVGQEATYFLWLWSAIQAPLAVIVSCVSAFPQLFSQSSTRPKPVWTPTDTYYQRIKLRLRAISKEKSTLEKVPTVSSSPGTSVPELNVRSGLRQPDESAISYDSLEMEPEVHDEIQHFRPAETNVALTHASQSQYPATVFVRDQVSSRDPEWMDGIPTREVVTYNETHQHARLD